MSFASKREAKRFLADKIAREASLRGEPLSDTEKRLLLFSEDEPDTVAGLPEEALAGIDTEYEKKITRLLRAAYRRDRDDDEQRSKYRDAMERLEGNDDYILVMAREALPDPHAARNLILYVVIGLAVAAIAIALEIWGSRR